MEQAGWTLRELLPSTDNADVEAALDGLGEAAAVLESFRPSLSPSMDPGEFKRLLGAVGSFAEKAAILGGFSALWFSEDTQDQKAIAFLGRVEQLLAEFQNRLLFVELWWKSLEDEDAERLIGHSGDLHYYLRKQRLFRSHTLTEAEEKVITLKDLNGSNALVTLYDMITNKFVFEIEDEGENRKVTRDALMAYVRHPSARVREAAYREQFRVYGTEATVLSQIYMNRARDWRNENVNMRGFSSPIAARNLSNDIPDEAVDVLLDACRSQSETFRRYFRLKAGWLGMERLRRFDIYAPMRDRPGRKIPYDEAVGMVLESFGRFSPAMRSHASRVLDEAHVDPHPRPGKRGGAFCMSVLPSLSPWVLMNYTGELRQVATLAHELGHAVHSLMASDHSVLTFHSALPLAETASVFSEMLLTDRLLEEETDPIARRALIAEVVDDAYATVLRQAYFVIFEREAHEMIAGGCTAGELNDLYLRNLGEQFGGSVDVDPSFAYEWTSIPHIYHAPFYCYAYCFGQLLSLSLYQRYKETGGPAREALLKILSHGGSESPGRILGEAGIDMADPEFWLAGLRAVGKMVDELESPGP